MLACEYMKMDTPSSYPSPTVQDLFKAILSLENIDEATNFFRDLLTLPEIKEFANRWQMVRLLNTGKSYLEIANELKTSSATVARVAQWLHYGTGGYKTIAERVFPKKFKDSQSPKPFRLRGKRTFY